MIIDLTVQEKTLLLETLGKAHAVEWMQNKETKHLEILIRKIVDSLKKEGNEAIFNEVFQEYKP